MKRFNERDWTSCPTMRSCRGHECRCLRRGRINVLLFVAVLASVTFLSIWWFRDDQKNATRPLVSSGQLEDVVLSESRQKTIWDAEHATFEIESKLGSRFLTAWVERDEQQLSEMLDPDFATDVTRATLQTRVHNNVSESSATSLEKFPWNNCVRTRTWDVPSHCLLRTATRLCFNLISWPLASPMLLPS